MTLPLRLRQIALALALCASVSGLFLLFRQRLWQARVITQSPADHARVEFRERLLSLAPPAPGTTLVLALGTSVLQAALSDVERLGPLLEQHLSQRQARFGPVNVAGVLVPALDLELLAGDLDSLLDLRPTLLLIELELLLPNLPYKLSMRDWVLGEPAWAAWRTRPKQRHERTQEKLEQTRVAFADAEVDRTRSFPIGVRLIRRAMARGVTVLVVETPPSPTARSLGAERLVRQRAEAIAPLLTSGVTQVRLGLDLPDEFYSDYRHLNEAGSRRFVSALLPRVAEALLERR